MVFSNLNLCTCIWLKTCFCLKSIICKKKEKKALHKYYIQKVGYSIKSYNLFIILFSIVKNNERRDVDQYIKIKL